MRRATGVQEEWPSRLLREQQAIQNPAYRPADTSQRGLGGNTAGPPPILQSDLHNARVTTRALADKRRRNLCDFSAFYR
jgi:hypothetical protein